MPDKRIEDPVDSNWRQFFKIATIPTMETQFF